MHYLESYLVVSSILFTFGIFAVITRKNAIAILMGIELILNSANVNFIAFNRFGNFEILDGHIFSIFVVVLAAAEAAIALAIIINLFKNIGTVNVDEAKVLKGYGFFNLSNIIILNITFSVFCNIDFCKKFGCY